MSDDREHEERALKLLLQALEDSGIEKRDSPRFSLSGETDAYYRIDKYNNVEVEFHAVKMFTGETRCTLGLRYLSEKTAELFPDDAEAVASLVAMLNYLRAVASGILLKTARNLHERRRNLTLKKMSADQRKSIRDAEREFVESIYAAAVAAGHRSQKRRDLEKEFTLAQEGRGGSGPKLAPGQIKALHKRYDQIHSIAKDIKKGYDRMRVVFDQSQKRRERTWKHWQKFWLTNATDLYEELPEFLALFAAIDKPSASEVAYRFLALQTSYKASYLQTLISKTRRKPQSNK